MLAVQLNISSICLSNSFLCAIGVLYDRSLIGAWSWVSTWCFTIPVLPSSLVSETNIPLKFSRISVTPTGTGFSDVGLLLCVFLATLMFESGSLSHDTSPTIRKFLESPPIRVPLGMLILRLL